ncbi:MAG: hypothetical protein ACLPZR_33840, partial [Solirubrobacteraceae bacterium]
VPKLVAFCPHRLRSFAVALAGRNSPVRRRYFAALDTDPSTGALTDAYAVEKLGEHVAAERDQHPKEYNGD